MYKEAAAPGALRLLSRILLYAVIGLIITLLATLVMSLLMSAGKLPESAGELTSLCCLPGSFVCGFFSARAAGRHMMLYGLVSGIVFLGLMILINLLFLPSLNLAGAIVGVLVSVIGGALLGSVCTALLHH